MSTLRGLSFHSVKGGVGKSTLATLSALGAALRFPDHTVVLIDMDLTGTSLADALPLCAPTWKETQGAPLPIDRLPEAYMDLAGSRDAIEARQFEEGPSSVPFLNDYLLYATPNWDESLDAKAKSVCWKMVSGPPNLWVAPSSALPADLDRSVPIIFDEYHAAFLESRLEFFIADLLAEAENLIVVVDVPPTVPGLSSAVLSLGLRLSAAPKQALAEDGDFPGLLEDAEVSWKSAFVASLDNQDIRAVNRWLRDVPVDEEPGLIAVVNRVTTNASHELDALITESLDDLPAPFLEKGRPIYIQDRKDLQIFKPQAGLPEAVEDMVAELLELLTP